MDQLGHEAFLNHVKEDVFTLSNIKRIKLGERTTGWGFLYLENLRCVLVVNILFSF